MKLSQLNEAVRKELGRRNLRNIKPRENALKKVCEFISAHASQYLLDDGEIFLPSDKSRLKTDYELYKGKVLSGAESSIINEIYHQYEPIKDRWIKVVGPVQAMPKPVIQNTFNNNNTELTSSTFFKTIEDLKQAGFKGFVSVSDLWQDSSLIPNIKGVYLVIRQSETAPEFLSRGTGGFFKGKDPNVSLDELRQKWINSTCVVYIGQAGGIKNGIQSRATLRSRLKQYLRFGQGKRAGHQGGCYIWQLKDAGNLLFCWKPLPERDPRVEEAVLIASFRKCYDGKLPFANRQK